MRLLPAISKKLFAKSLALTGLALLFGGMVAIQFLGNSGVETSILLGGWMFIQTASYIVAGVGFVGLLNLNNKRTPDPMKPKSRIKLVLQKLALMSIISGLVLTFPLFQIAFPVPIATVFVSVGLVLLGISLIFWFLSAFFFTRSE